MKWSSAPRELMARGVAPRESGHVPEHSSPVGATKLLCIHHRRNSPYVQGHHSQAADRLTKRSAHVCTYCTYASYLHEARLL